MGQWKALKRDAGSGAWKELHRDAGSGWKALEWESLYEDFTTFTEIDVGADRIQKTAYHVDHLARRDEETFLYKDYGINYFSDFTHKIKIRQTETSGAGNSIGFCWGVANAVNGIQDLKTSNEHSIFLSFYKISGSDRIYFWETYNGSNYNSANYFVLTLNTWYYIKIIKSGTSMHAYVYSDSGYSNLLATLTLTLHASLSSRYLYVCNTYDTGVTYACVNDIDNFDLG